MAATVFSLDGCEPDNNIDINIGSNNNNNNIDTGVSLVTKQASSADNIGGDEEEEEVNNAIDVEDGSGSGSFRDREELMTTLQPTSSTTEQITTLPSSLDNSDLPLCSEVSTLPPRIGIGLINKFSISTTAAPVPCRNADELVTTTAATATTAEEEEEETTTASGTGTLFQQLADKFGSGR